MGIKVHFFMIIIFFFFVLKNSNCTDFVSKSIVIKPGVIQSVSLNYEFPSLLNFNDVNNPLLAHINSINCEIEVYFNDSLKEDKNIKMIKNNEAFLVNINRGNNNIYVRPLNVQNDNIKYRNCPIVINSMNNNNFHLKIKEENSTVFYFNKALTSMKLSFEAKEYFKNKNNTFITFSFIFYEKATFKINIPEIKYGQERIISNSHNVFLTQNSFPDFRSLDIITISLEQINYSNPVLVQFRVITKSFNPQILQKNYLNQGFITSDLKYQYYYMEIFQGEEVEIMLHDKRQNGKLLGTIMNKTNFSLTEKSFHEEIDNNYFQENIQKLTFSYEKTDSCVQGCYILISYFHNDFETEKEIIGYEFTLLSRIWSKEDFSDTNIVNIPEKEYIFGYFEESTINQHYYSIFISKETDTVLVELNGNYIQFFYGEGKRKLNTYNPNIDTTEELTLKGEMSFKTLKGIDFKNKYISFAIRSKDFFKDIPSYYYFRIFQLKRNENLIIPMDSNIENLCSPKYYECFILLSNYYNEFSNYSTLYPFSSNYEKNIFSYNSYKNITLDISNEALNKLCINITEENKINNQENMLDFILLKYRFLLSDDIQTFFSYFYDKGNEIYPQVYSPQIFKINGKITLNKLNNHYTRDYSLSIKWINGTGDIINFIPKKLHLNKNQKEKLYSIPIPNNNVSIEGNNLDIYIQLSYNNNNYKEEINDNIIISEIIDETYLPIYFYSSINKYTYHNKDITFKVLNYNEDSSKFSIEAMYCGRDEIYDFKNENYINFHTNLTIEYDNILKSGFLKIYQEQLNYDHNDNDYIIIKIDEINKKSKDSILIEINSFTFYEGYPLSYTLPYNQFILGYYNLSYNNEIFYPLLLDNNDNDTIILEFSSNFPGINIDFEGKDLYYKDGIEKYKIKNQNEGEINLKIYLNESYEYKDLLQGNYILRYYYVPDDFFEPKYEFDKIYNIKGEEIIKDNSISLLFEFNNIQIINIPENYTNNTINYTIYCNLFLNENINELLNTISINSAKPIAQKIVYSSNSEEKFLVNFTINSTKISNYNYIMQIKFYVASDNINDDIVPYSIKMDLTEYLTKKETKKDNKKIFIVSGICGVIFLIILLVVLIFICKIKKKNAELKEKILSMSFSAGKSEFVLTEDNALQSKRDEEYENTFI